ncbi:RNA polymerase subunit sigma-24, partial [Actinoplanes sp. NPDC048791]
QVARFFAGRAGAMPGMIVLERTVNGRPGLVVRLAGGTVSVMAFDVADARIRNIWAVLNPDKLRLWTAD